MGGGLPPALFPCSARLPAQALNIHTLFDSKPAIKLPGLRTGYFLYGCTYRKPSFWGRLEFANGLADRARMVARILLRSWALRSNDGGNEGGETRVMVTKLTRLQHSIIRLLGVDPRTYRLA
jgi:hypothetical protein